MVSILLRAFSMALVFALGIFFRSTGFVPANASDTVKKLALYLTIPAAIITSFSKISEIGGEMILVMLLGIITGAIVLAASILLTRGKPNPQRAYYMLCLPSYSLATSTIPFIQSFLPPVGAITASIFDVGNSIMCVGITYAFTVEYLSEEKHGFDFKLFFKRLCSSAPLMTYIVMYILTSVHFTVPGAVLSLIQPMANANAFVCMMMLGLQFRMELKKEYFGELAKVIVLRNAISLLFALLFYFVFPLALPIRQALVLLVFSSIPATAPTYTGMAGGDEGMASAANGISIIISLIIMTSLLGIMGLY